MKRSIRGTLHAYWEQGWKGRIEFAFLPDGDMRPIFLENNQNLTIYNTNGTMLWYGTIRFVKRNRFDQHRLRSDIWAERKQIGVSYANWMEWFWQHPALRARLDFEVNTPLG